MNANKLADELENKPLAYGNDIQEWLSEAATMLRQQQAEIEALKAKTLTDEEIDDIGREHLTDGDGAIEFARAILKKASEK